jgi:hypothetical protein
MTTPPFTTDSLAVLDGRLQELAAADGRRFWRTPDGDAVSLAMSAGWRADAVTGSHVVSTDWIRGVEVIQQERHENDVEVCAGELHVPFEGATFRFDVTCRGRHTSWGGPLPAPADRLRVLLDVVAAAVRPVPALVRAGPEPLPEPDHYVPAPHGVVRALNGEAALDLLQRLVGTEVNTILAPSINVFAETGALDVPVGAIVVGDRPLLFYAGSLTGGARQTSVDFVTVLDSYSTLEGYASSIRIALRPAAIERVQLYQRHVLSWARDEEFLYDALLVLWRTDGVAVRLRALESSTLAVSVSSPGVVPSAPRYALRWDSRWEVPS